MTADPRKRIAAIVAAAQPPPPLTIVAPLPRAGAPGADKPSRAKRRKRAPAGGVEAVDSTQQESARGEDGGEAAPIPPETIAACALEPLNDTGNGKRLLHHFGTELLHVRAVGWHVYNGTHWDKEGGDEAVTRYAQLAAARIRLERATLTYTKPEQEAVEAGEAAEAELKVLYAAVLARSEEAQKVEESRLQLLIAEGRAAKKALNGRKSARAKFAVASGNAARIAGMIGQALPHRTVPIAALDRDPDAFNVLDGTLRFVQIRDDDCPDPDVIRLKWAVRQDPHDRADLITKCAPAKYDPSALCPEWDRFLEMVQPLPHLRVFLRDFHGYGLTGRTGIQGLVYNAGFGANGKSTFIEAIMKLLGDYGDTLNPESFTGQQQKRGDQATPDIADLPGKRLVRVSELPEKAKLQETLVKALTGGEPIKARHNYDKRFFLFYPVFKVTMSGNAKPDIHDISEGMWRRLMIVPWNVRIPDDTSRREFAEMQRLFEAERSGILNWLIEGCLSFLNAGSKLAVPEEVRAATAEHREDMDPIGQFLTACCERVEGARLTGGELYARYVGWCEASGLKPLHNSTFGKTVPKHGWVKVKIGVVYYLDMQMHKDAPVPVYPPGHTPRDPPFED